MWLMDTSTLEWQWFKSNFNVHICTKIFLYQEWSKLGLKIYGCVYTWKWEKQTTWPASWETYVKVRKQQLELGMEKQTGSK